MRTVHVHLSNFIIHRELATYQKTVISGYYDQISAKKGNQKKK